MMDHGIAGELGVDVETYIKVIDGKCTEEEANFIILAILEEDADNIEKAKEQIPEDLIKMGMEFMVDHVSNFFIKSIREYKVNIL